MVATRSTIEEAQAQAGPSNNAAPAAAQSSASAASASMQASVADAPESDDDDHVVEVPAPVAPVAQAGPAAAVVVAPAAAAVAPVAPVAPAAPAVSQGQVNLAIQATLADMRDWMRAQGQHAPAGQDARRSRSPPPRSVYSHHEREPRLSQAPAAYVDRIERLKASDLPKFSGKVGGDQDVDTWIETVTMLYEASEAPLSALLRALPLVFKDEALKWLTALGPDRHRLTTWALWCEALRSEFREPNYKQNLVIAIRNRRLRQNEDFNTYYHDKVALLRRRYGHDFPYEDIVASLMEGLPEEMHPSIRPAVKNRTTRSSQYIE